MFAGYSVQYKPVTHTHEEFRTDFLDPLGVVLFRAVEADVEAAEQIAFKWNGSEEVLQRKRARLARMVVYAVSCRGHRIVRDCIVPKEPHS